MGMEAGGLPPLPLGPAVLSGPWFPGPFRTWSKLARSLCFSERQACVGEEGERHPPPPGPWRARGAALVAVAADTSETSWPPWQRSKPGSIAESGEGRAAACFCFLLSRCGAFWVCTC